METMQVLLCALFRQKVDSPSFGNIDIYSRSGNVVQQVYAQNRESGRGRRRGSSPFPGSATCSFFKKALLRWWNVFDLEIIFQLPHQLSLTQIETLVRLRVGSLTAKTILRSSSRVEKADGAAKETPHVLNQMLQRLEK